MNTPHHSRRDRHPRPSAAQQTRAARRASLAALLDLADRGTLRTADAAALREHVEAELAEGDKARRGAVGQQAAARRLLRRIDAAEQAIIETEADRDRLQRQLDERRQHPADDGAPGPAGAAGHPEGTCRCRTGPISGRHHVGARTPVPGRCR
ncbi:hypothetical protein RKE29_02745 [Streptomyces sp. B1866]|uniref:hypothetical protein n=1 Tax=Streptomyces sp. B1866 TaxID=3075431 RepID=UPI00288DD46F|nr:hypothetical protein [Streptomyces sp. B1866]MDT3395577.1 hypothetical protein [Streptomyces sp. B1866]